jgi:hypothetical protein
MRTPCIFRLRAPTCITVDGAEIVFSPSVSYLLFLIFVLCAKQQSVQLNVFYCFTENYSYVAQEQRKQCNAAFKVPYDVQYQTVEEGLVQASYIRQGNMKLLASRDQLCMSLNNAHHTNIITFSTVWCLLDFKTDYKVRNQIRCLHL